MNEIEKAIENMKSHVNAYENNLRSINTVNSINKDWDGKSALGQPISINDKRYVYTVESLESCKASINALEKQIPKKPMIMQLAEPEYMCTVCGMKYWRKGGIKYCIDCGQAIDWEE